MGVLAGISLRKELREDLLEGLLVDETGRALLLEAAINQLYLLPGESGVGGQRGQLFRLVAATESEGTGRRTP